MPEEKRFTTLAEEAAALDESWRAALAQEFSKPYFASLCAFVDAQYSACECYPPRGAIFEAFNRTPFDKTKVVIIGQDPYPNPGQAHGLCFSVREGVPPPRSLANIFKELATEFGRAPHTTDLTFWAQQGVLLVNTTLTVARSAPLSHAKCGWEEFTSAAVAALAAKRKNIVFMLWGAHAQKKGAAIDPERHLVLASAHPSPLSARRGFFGCGHFRKANDYLAANSSTPIHWL